MWRAPRHEREREDETRILRSELSPGCVIQDHYSLIVVVTQRMAVNDEVDRVLDRWMWLPNAKEMDSLHRMMSWS
jgi:hypothetical protein